MTKQMIPLLALLGWAVSTLPEHQEQTAPCPPVRVRQQLETRLQSQLDEFVRSDQRVPSALLHVEAPSLCVDRKSVV